LQEVAIALNDVGYRSTGTHGARLFSKDTMKSILINRFDIRYIPDGNGDWMKARHQPFIATELYEEVQRMRDERKYSGDMTNSNAQTYSLTSLTRCQCCDSSLRIHKNKKGRPRLYCAGRAKGDSECNSKLTFLDSYEAQIEWYLQHFHIPENYQEQLLEAHSKLRSAYSDVQAQKTTLENRLLRTKELYEWGDITKEDYLMKKRSIENEMRSLTVPDDHSDVLRKLADFPANVAQAWDVASHEQRNKLARMLFEEIRIENEKVVAVRPRPELEPFFKLNFD
jgi:hypothetical protein